MTADDARSSGGAPPRWVAWAVALAAVAALTIWRPLAPDGGDVHEFVGPTMGTTYTVTVDADLSEQEHERVRRVVEERLDLVTRLMSTYEPGSQVSRFNEQPGTSPFPVAAEVIDVLEVARSVAERSGGAFDVTVAPLVDAWGFGAADPAGPLPDGERLLELLGYVGFELLTLDRAAGTVAKADARMRVDLSGVAQGYAADLVAAALDELGLSSHLVDVGGELRASGARRSDRPWRVGIESPVEDASVWGTVDLRDEGVATSGDYRNWFEDAGARYAHIIDPRTGRPIAMRGVSVTVVHRSAALADAWATALCVLGPDEGFELARREGLAAAFITSREGAMEARLTPLMEARAEAID